jgi:hypothetical protein
MKLLETYLPVDDYLLFEEDSVIECGYIFRPLLASFKYDSVSEQRFRLNVLPGRHRKSRMIKTDAQAS